MNLLFLFLLGLAFQDHLSAVAQSIDCGEAFQDTTDENEFAAQIAQVPWMVSIGILNGDSYTHQCGGSLITPLHVLTAAHCFNEFSLTNLPPGYSIRLGTSNYENPTNYTVTQSVKSAVKHPKYFSQGGTYFDAGILTLTQPVSINQYVRFLCLPVRPVDDEGYLTGDLVTLTGWGIEQLTKKDKTKKTTDLKFINLKVLSNDECNVKFSRETLKNKHSISPAGLRLRDKQLSMNFTRETSCVENPFKVRNACEGDSGSPVIKSFSGTARGVKVYEQEFIVSDSIDCTIPAVIYTRVTNRNILAWIKETTDTENYLMVVGGYRNGEVLSEVEIISKDPYNKCPAEISQLPIKAQGMVGGFTKRAAIVCGGGSNFTDINEKCYEYIPKNNSWIEIPGLSRPRFDATAVNNDEDNLWIIGGTYDQKSVIQGGAVTEVYGYRPNSDGESLSGKQLPSLFRDNALQNHCSVRLNGTHIFVGGGFVPRFAIEDPLMVLKAINPEAFANIMPRYSGNFTINKSWLFDGFAWANISSMIVRRAKAACTAAFSEQFNTTIIVAGGCTKLCNEQDEGLQSAEMYFPHNNTWVEIADLPVPLHSAKLDLLGEMPTLIGGFNGKEESDVIYQYHLSNNTWVQHPTKLETGRSSPTVFQIPKSLVRNC